MVLRLIVGILSLIGIVTWGQCMLMAIAMSGFGGSGSDLTGLEKFAALGMFTVFPYLLFCFLSCFSWFSRQVMICGAILNNILFIPIGLSGQVLEGRNTELIFNITITFELIWLVMMYYRLFICGYGKSS